MDRSRDNTANELPKHHSIESALIQASSKGYTIDMILGNHENIPGSNSLSKGDSFGYSANAERDECGR